MTEKNDFIKQLREKGKKIFSDETVAEIFRKNADEDTEYTAAPESDSSQSLRQIREELEKKFDEMFMPFKEDADNDDNDDDDIDDETDIADKIDLSSLDWLFDLDNPNKEVEEDGESEDEGENKDDDENEDTGENEDADEDLDNIIILSDENGNDVPFEFIDLIEYEGEEYVILLPAEDIRGAGDEVVILKIEDSDEDSDTESYVSVDSEETLGAVFKIFKEKFKDVFNFTDESTDQS